MQAFLAVAWLLLAVAVAGLAYAVGRLRSESAALRRALDDVRAERSPAQVPVTVPEPVAVITQLASDDVRDQPDPSASRVASVALGGPLIKVAAFSTGLKPISARPSDSPRRAPSARYAIAFKSLLVMPATT